MTSGNVLSPTGWVAPASENIYISLWYFTVSLNFICLGFNKSTKQRKVQDEVFFIYYYLKSLNLINCHGKKLDSKLCVGQRKIVIQMENRPT